MQYPALIVTDLHLTDDPSTEYRWGLFPWLNEQIKEHRVRSLLVLGDVTDAKDAHRSALVNRVVSSFSSLRIDDITILAGNHDWLKQGEEFFRFLNLLPNIKFITQPYEDFTKGGPLAYFLPYSKNPYKDWSGMDFSHYDLLFMHQTIKGAVASNGQEMDGEELPDFSGPRVYSGDIHVPQTIGGLTYVGSPYHVHFGDNFKPRAILLDRNGVEHDLHFETIKRVVIKATSLQELRRKRLRAGDQVKLRVELSEAEKHQWHRIRREAVEYLEACQVSVHGVELIVAKANKRVEVGGRQGRALLSPQELITRFVDREELGANILDAALDIMEDK